MKARPGMKRASGRRVPRRSTIRSTLTTRTKHSTVPKGVLETIPGPPQPLRKPAKLPPSRKQVARIVGDDESSLLDLLDNLLAKGVMLNADLILALANVDLVYVRLSALLCAADRVLGPDASRRGPFPPKLRSGKGE